MNYLDKFQIKSAVDSRSKFDFGSDHITTASWMQYNVAWYLDMVPNSDVDVEMQTFTRLLPLARPTFGRLQIHNRSFFVPYEIIFPQWNDFIMDTQHIPYSGNIAAPVGMITQSPQITNNSLVGVFVNGTSNNTFFSTTRGSSSADGSNYDVCCLINGTPTYYFFTNAGRQLYKLLLSLGYGIIWDDSDLETYDALHIMAALKIYIDWYYPSQYANSGSYAVLASLLKQDGTVNFVVSSSYVAAFVDALLYVNYNSDYFTSAWDNPMSPNVGLFSTIDIPDVSRFDVRQVGTNQSNSYNTINPLVRNGSIGTSANVNHGRMGSTDGTPFIETANSVNYPGTGTIGASVSPISQYLLNSLRSLTDFMKRNQLAGGHSITS